jgi:hypothetical protein
MAPSTVVAAPTTGQMAAGRRLRPVAGSERIAPPSHRGYRPASHMARCKHYDPYRRASLEAATRPDRDRLPTMPVSWHFV